MSTVPLVAVDTALFTASNVALAAFNAKFAGTSVMAAAMVLLPVPSLMLGLAVGAGAGLRTTYGADPS
jgi:hypothetical protein